MCVGGGGEVLDRRGEERKKSKERSRKGQGVVTNAFFMNPGSDVPHKPIGGAAGQRASLAIIPLKLLKMIVTDHSLAEELFDRKRG